MTPTPWPMVEMSVRNDRSRKPASNSGSFVNMQSEANNSDLLTECRLACSRSGIDGEPVVVYFDDEWLVTSFNPMLLAERFWSTINVGPDRWMSSKSWLCLFFALAADRAALVGGCILDACGAVTQRLSARTANIYVSADAIYDVADD